MRAVFIAAALVSGVFHLCAEERVCGLWKIVDDRRGICFTIIAVYEHDSVLYGRNIVNYSEKDGTLVDTLYVPRLKVPRLDGSPFLTDINLFWGLRKVDGRWIRGRVLDPRSGRVYGCELWFEDGRLMLRGKWGPFSKTQILYPANEEDFPHAFEPPPVLGWGPMIPPLR